MSFEVGEDRRTAVDRALARAEELRKEKRYDEGITLLRDALRYGIEQAQLHYRLGNLYYDAGKYEEAEYAYRQAITHDPLHINAHYNLGVVYRRMGRMDESIKMRKKANALARRHPERVRVRPEQVKYARRYARNFFLGGLLFVVLLVLVLLWLLR
jgi:tetratricopeptide (TPR) repeat protein